MKVEIPTTLEGWNERGKGAFPAHLGAWFEKVEPDEVIGLFDVKPSAMAWNGYLHAGTVVTLADTCCAYGALRTLPEGAEGFTTIDLATNFIGTALEGAVRCAARPLHLGGATQVWDAVVSAEATGRRIAHFRCTQMVLRPRPKG